MKQIEILIVGNGNYSQQYQRILNSYNIKYIVINNTEELLKLNLKKIRCIFIVIPFNKNLEIIKILVKKCISKKIVIEKPIISTAEEYIYIEKLSKENQVYSGHILRYIKSVEKVNEILISLGLKIERILIERCTMKKMRSWWYKNKNFLFWYEGVHSFDFIQYITGSLDIQSVEGNFKYVEEGINTNFWVSANLNEVKVSIHHNMLSDKKINTILIESKKHKIKIVDYSSVFLDDNLVYSNDVEKELYTGLENQIVDILKENSSKKISWSEISKIYENMLNIESLLNKKLINISFCRERLKGF